MDYLDAHELAHIERMQLEFEGRLMIVDECEAGLVLFNAGACWYQGYCNLHRPA